jgi:phosphatidylinositol alpha-1,6-mannosyltransferase
MKKILLTTNFFPPEYGGIQNYLYNITLRLPKDNIFVLADKNDVKEFDADQPFKIYRKSFKSPLRFLKLTSLDLYLKTKSIIDKENINLLWAGHFYLPALTCYLFKKARGLPYFIFAYGKEITELQNVSQIKKRLMQKIFSEADRIITISDYLKSKLENTGVDRHKITKIYPGVDSEVFSPKDQPKARKKISNLIGRDIKHYNIILSVGRLVKRKGHDMVIKSLSSVLKRYPKTTYLIVGDGPDRERLKMLTSKLNLERYVIFSGAPKSQDLPNYYNASDLFIMPSRILNEKKDVEGFGIVYLEASACGKPIIAGKGGGVAEAVENKKTGILADPENPDEIAEATLKLLNNPKLAKNLGQAGRERVVRDFNWDKLVEKLTPLIE